MCDLRRRWHLRDALKKDIHQECEVPGPECKCVNGSEAGLSGPIYSVEGFSKKEVPSCLSWSSFIPLPQTYRRPVPVLSGNSISLRNPAMPIHHHPVFQHPDS